jgi:hypothetical protein
MRVSGSAEPMKTILIIIVLVVVAATVYADRKWRQWMAARRRERQ